ncbi:hypothetical protein ACFPYN_05150 [Paenisporosarcina macmurdoensis]|uniref:DUF3221 domain-containing protein n=1 Tax=Paenisporosarcina macmurdoensis TaxID=212659 RepID=A0ABW1L4D4_9BACL
MTNYPKRILVVLLVLFSVGCGSGNTNLGYSEVTIHDITEFFIVEMIHENSILIGNTFYKIGDETKLITADNRELKFEEIKPGDLVAFEDKGYILESFPSQGFATKVVLQNDDESKRVSNSLRHFINNQQTGNILSISILKLTEQEITLNFNEREIHGKKYEAEIDRKTNEFTVKEIPNEEALEQDRLNQAMKAAHPEGITSGHITEIYEDGFRVNMVDFTFSEDAQLKNDLGTLLDREQFKIGSFVTVDYDKIDASTTVNTGVLSVMTLITKEENPQVRSWIESIIEGDSYEEPAIMQNYSHIEPKYYSIIIADLKDDTWDTFELKYDIETNEYSTTRIKN